MALTGLSPSDGSKAITLTPRFAPIATAYNRDGEGQYGGCADVESSGDSASVPLAGPAVTTRLTLRVPR